AAFLDVYLAATPLYAGPTSFLSTVWQLEQAFSFRSSCASAASKGPLANAKTAAADNTRGFMKFSGKVEKFCAMLLYFFRLGNLFEQIFQAIDRRKAGNALAHPGVDLDSCRLGEDRRQVTELGPRGDHHGVRQIALRERAPPAPQLRRWTAQNHGARRALVLLQRGEQRRVPCRLPAHRGMKL